MDDLFDDHPVDPFREPSEDGASPPPTVANRESPNIQQVPVINPVSQYPLYGGTVEKPAYIESHTAVPMGTPPPGIPSQPAAAAGIQSPSASALGGSTPQQPAIPPQPTSKFWTIEFYQQFFDIDTRQVLIRLSNTLVPLNPPDFLMDRNWHYNSTGESVVQTADGDLVVGDVTLSRKPDLYGPFWVCTTLWMTLGIVSNVMNKLAYTRAGKTSDKPWQYDFSVASVACIVMYLYCFVFGSVVWGIMQWKNLPVSLTDTICLYGYSMFIFLLTAILCMIPISGLQWLFVIVGGLWSTAYLLINFWHMWKAALEPRWFIGIVVLVSAFHFGLTLSFKFYFMNYSY